MTRVSGTAIYLTRSPFSTPPAFTQNIKHNKIIHERVIFISIGFKNVPYVRSEDRIRFEKLPRGFYRVLVKYGFMNRADMQAVMHIIQNKHLKIDMEETTFFVGRGTLIPTSFIGMSEWRDRLYIRMARNAARATTYFNLPPDRVLEMGTQIRF